MSTTMLIIFLVALFLNVPIAISIGMASVFVLIFIGNFTPSLIANTVHSAANSFILTAVIYFVLAGNIMQNGGISTRIIAFAKALVGATTGGLGAILILASFFMAAITGSGLATIAAVGMFMIPMLVNGGYDKGYAAGLQATSGGMGIILPPSIPMIIFGTLTGASVGALFIAGVIPGILMCIMTMIVNYYICRKRGYGKSNQGVALSERNFKEVWRTFKEAIWALFMPILILGGIYSGVFTPTEAACVAVVYCLFIGFFVYKELKLKDLKKICIESCSISAVVILVIAMASPFSWVLAVERIPNMIADFASTYFTNYIVFLLVLNAVFLFVGCFMSSTASLIIMAPVLVPIAAGLNIDLVHLGIIMIICMEIGMMTPPFGVSLLVSASVAGTTMEKVSLGALPYVAVDTTLLLLVTFIPAIALYLPRLMNLM